MAKATNAEINRRVFTVFRKLMTGATTATIIHFAREKWNIQDDMARDYLSRANELCEKTDVKNAQVLKEKNLALRYQLIDIAIKNGELETAHGLIADADKLLGNYPSEKSSHDIRLSHPIRFMALEHFRTNGHKPASPTLAHKNGNSNGHKPSGS